MHFRWAKPLALLATLMLALVLGGASVAAGPTITWAALKKNVPHVVDLTAPNAQGAIYVAADGRLDVMSAAGAIHSFAPAFHGPAGLENYMALSSGDRVPASDCTWPAGNLYTVRLFGKGRGITVVTPQGRVSKFVSLNPRGLENGIAFDQFGRFGYRLLVTATTTTKRATGVTTLYAVSCNRRVQILTRTGPRVEGGMVIAPSDFGRFAGDLLAPDEYSSTVWAFAPNGHATVLVHTGVPTGPDTGTESLGIVPAHFTMALVSDRAYPPDKEHPGDNEILDATQSALSAAGVHPGDLLAVGEGGGATVAVTCAPNCKARYIGRGPARAHIEGHIVFLDTG